jgi:hypothetical protein
VSEFVDRINDTPFHVDEAAGAVLVWRGEVVLAAFPWHSHVHVEGATLYVFDVRSWRLLRSFGPGTWTRVGNETAV